MGWREDVEQALRNLGGEGDLGDIYREIERLRPGALGPTWQSTVRGTLEAHSSDSKVWKRGSPDVFRRVSSGRWAARPPEPAEVGTIINAITRGDLLAAIHDLDSGVQHQFGESIRYDVLFKGKRYAPKAVVGLAATRQLGRPLSPDEFSGGLHSRTFRALEKNGFQIVEKGAGGETALDSQLPETVEGNVWIEFSTDLNHGGPGWEFGACLWSPSRSADGKDWFSPMRAIKPNDLIIHSRTGQFVGFSYAKSAYREVNNEPPQADRWKGTAPYYRIDLRDYSTFAIPVGIGEFLKRFEDEIKQDLARPDRPKFYPFVVQSGALRKFEGAYLSPCSVELYQLIRIAVSTSHIAIPGPSEKRREPRFWSMALGEQGRLWNECQEQGIVAIGWDYLGDLSRYADQGSITAAILEHSKSESQPTNQSFCCWQFVHDMAIGDFIVAKIGRSRILGVGMVQSNYEYRPSREEYHNVRAMRWLKVKTLELPPDSILTAKTLTDISDYEKVMVFVRENYLEDTSPATESHEPYTTDQAISGLFLPRSQFESMLESLRIRKNVIIQGPPGVGKTFIAKRLAWVLIGFRDESRVQIVQFHQSYAYEDFVQGWRPAPDGGFRLRNGVFYEFCTRARGDLGIPYVFIIDEINRGNLSKIFGELMMLVEVDKRGADYAIPLTYSETGEQFSVPENIHLVGLMNTADRSLAMVDYALRRRFRFVELRPQFDQPEFASHLKAHGASDALIAKIVGRISELNAKIEADHKNLGRGFVVGHSFFCLNSASVKASEEWYEQVVKGEIAPLIEEYWFDRPERAKEWMDRLLAQ